RRTRGNIQGIKTLHHTHTHTHIHTHTHKKNTHTHTHTHKASSNTDTQVHTHYTHIHTHTTHTPPLNTHTHTHTHPLSRRVFPVLCTGCAVAFWPRLTLSHPTCSLDTKHKRQPLQYTHSCLNTHTY